MSDINIFHLRETIVNLENTVFHVMTVQTGSIFAHETINQIDQKFLQTRHTHVAAELFVCIRGEILIDTQFSVFVLKEGDAALVPPGIMHYKIPDESGSEYEAILFSCKHRNVSNTEDIYHRLIPFFTENKIFLFRKRPDVVASVVEIVELAKKKDALLPALKGAELLIHLTENAECGQKTAGGMRTADSDYNRLSVLENYMETSFMKSLSIKEVADYLHLSTRQVDRIVRKHLGTSFHQAIMERRIRTAEKMLLTTDMTAENIGFSVGFSSLSGFYREFVKAYGMTPGEYRKRKG